MKTLITGVAEFIGSNFLYYFLNQHSDCDIIGIDNLTYAGNLKNFDYLNNEQKKRFQFIKSDISDYKSISDVFKNNEIDSIINFAAESHVDRSIHDPQIFLKTNIIGTQNLLHIAKENWKREDNSYSNKKFVQISTDEVYGSLGPEGYFTEKNALDPHSPYSASKAGADLITKAYYDTYNFPINITRCSNNYGPFQFPEKLIPLIINNCLTNKPIPIYGDGQNIRDWLYVEDHCSAIDTVLFNGHIGEVYNIGGNNEVKNIDMVKKIIKLLYEKTENNKINDKLIKYVPDRLGHDKRYAINSTKIKTKLGWEPKASIEEGLEMTINWYLEHKKWLEDIINGEYLSFYEKNYELR